MKRVIALVALLAGLGVLVKLAGKGSVAPAGAGAGAGPGSVTAAGGPGGATAVDPEAAIRVKYPADAALVDRTLQAYHHNAVAIERTDGLRGLVLLDRLGLE